MLSCRSFFLKRKKLKLAVRIFVFCETSRVSLIYGEPFRDLSKIPNCKLYVRVCLAQRIANRFQKFPPMIRIKFVLFSNSIVELKNCSLFWYKSALFFTFFYWLCLLLPYCLWLVFAPVRWCLPLQSVRAEIFTQCFMMLHGNLINRAYFCTLEPSWAILGNCHQSTGNTMLTNNCSQVSVRLVLFCIISKPIFTASGNSHLDSGKRIPKPYGFRINHTMDDAQYYGNEACLLPPDAKAAFVEDFFDHPILSGGAKLNDSTYFVCRSDRESTASFVLDVLHCKELLVSKVPSGIIHHGWILLFDVNVDTVYLFDFRNMIAKLAEAKAFELEYRTWSLRKYLQCSSDSTSHPQHPDSSSGMPQPPLPVQLVPPPQPKRPVEPQDSEPPSQPTDPNAGSAQGGQEATTAKPGEDGAAHTPTIRDHLVTIALGVGAIFSLCCLCCCFCCRKKKNQAQMGPTSGTSMPTDTSGVVYINR